MDNKKIRITTRSVEKVKVTRQQFLSKISVQNDHIKEKEEPSLLQKETEKIEAGDSGTIRQEPE